MTSYDTNVAYENLPVERFCLVIQVPLPTRENDRIAVFKGGDSPRKVGANGYRK